MSRRTTSGTPRTLANVDLRGAEQPRGETVVEPLPLAGATSFEPFSYGDHLRQAMAAFSNFTGISHVRRPRGPGERTGCTN